jgi:hypothetical protein
MMLKPFSYPGHRNSLTILFRTHMTVVSVIPHYITLLNNLELLKIIVSFVGVLFNTIIEGLRELMN